MGKALAVLDAHLATRTYLVGDFVTLADIVACCNLLPGMVNVMDGKFMQEFGNVQRWFTTCVAKPEFSSVMGTVTVAKKAKKAAKRRGRGCRDGPPFNSRTHARK